MVCPADEIGSSQPLESRASRLVRATDSSRLDYSKPVDEVGFERVPKEVVSDLVSRGLLQGEELVGEGEDPVAKRRSDGSHYQSMAAWWGSKLQYLSFDCHRELTLISRDRFRPFGKWSASGSVYTFMSGTQVCLSHWTRAAGGGGTARAEGKSTHDPLALLPPHIVEPIRGHNCCAYLRSGKGYAIETIFAARVDSDRIKMLRALRQGSSRAALEKAEWAIATVDAQIDSIYTFLAGAESGTVQLPGSGVSPKTTGSRKEIPK